VKQALTLFFSCLFITASVLAQVPVPASSDSSHNSSTGMYVDIGAAVVLTTIMLHYDQQIYDELYSFKMNNVIVKEVSPVITNLGDGAFSIGLFGGFLGYGFVFKSDKAFEVGKIGIESFLLAGITVQLLKQLCGRERPINVTREGGFWYGSFAYFNKHKGGGKGLASFDAFPSGHTATVFAAATTISDFYTAPWVSYTCYSLASVVAISRVMERTHWISDCFVGAIIGYYGTKLVEKQNYGSGDITLLPQADEHQYGLLLSVKF
jgi:membrane-associated phospholipid phosphatase